MEKRGVPTALVASTPFVDLARRNAGYQGIPDLAVVEAPHPIGGVDPKVIRQRAAAMVDKALSALVAQEQAPKSRA
ncbi:MAG: hypothetical protein Q7T26_12080 [Dehalococcoidia bacterium]|nr:hypothetical protein [Dehalococcoidia bacterium]